MSGADSPPDNKVARVIDEYDLDGWGQRLEDRWTGADGDRESLRDLAASLNRAVFETALDRSGISMTDRDAGSAYETLTDDSVSQADRLRKERELEQEGLDVDAVRSDFVTHQTIHTYLTSERGASLPETPPRPEREADSIQRLQGRATVVVESTIDRLIDRDALTDHEYEVFADVQVVCEDCGTSYDAADLVREGGCTCSS
ncbi:hypothetical protein GCM10028857_21960 [Salinarchaeum chitinilyticum]